MIIRTLGRLKTLLSVGPRGWSDLAGAQIALLLWSFRKAATPKGRFLAVARIDETGKVPASKPSLPSSLSSTRRKRITQLEWAVHQTARFGPGRPKCLVRSLALRDLMHREGFSTCRVRLGVRKLEGEFQAHAWVELDGMVIGDAPSHVESFRKLPELLSGLDRNAAS